MRKAVLLIAAVSASVCAAVARADVITYTCDEPDEPESLKIDTKTHSVIEVGAQDQTPGTAQISSTAIVVTLTSSRVWSIQIDRNTGAFLDSDGTTGTCVLAGPPSTSSSAEELNKKIVAEYSSLNGIAHDCQHAAEIKAKLKYFVSQLQRADKMAHERDPQIHSNRLVSEGDLETWTICSARPSVALLNDAIAKYRLANSIAPNPIIQTDIDSTNEKLLKIGGQK